MDDPTPTTGYCSVADTPRTNEREALSYGLHEGWCFTFCRQLERELNAANERIAAVEASEKESLDAYYSEFAVVETILPNPPAAISDLA